MDSYMILTNNPLAARKLEGRRTVCYISVPYEELLREAEKKICQGHRLLSHPLSGSVKPKETPYKSIMLSGKKEEVDPQSVRMIEAAIQTCEKFTDRQKSYGQEVYEDFQLIDWTLLESAIESANVW